MLEFRCYNVVFRKVFAQKCSEFVIKYLVMDCVPLASVAQRHKNSFKRRKMPKLVNLLAGIFTLGLEKISYFVPLTRLTKLNGSFVASIGKNVCLNRWAQGNGFRKTTGVIRKFVADLVVIIPLGEFISSVPYPEPAADSLRRGQYLAGKAKE